MTKEHLPVKIDLDRFNLQINLPGLMRLTLQFDTPSRRFYLSLMALVVEQMKQTGKISFVPLDPHIETLALLNETVGASAGSSQKKSMTLRIYRKWKDALPDLENAPLFRVAGRKKVYDDGTEKTYRFDDSIKDAWANLFTYQGSRENLSLQFSIDRLGFTLDEIGIVYGTETQDGKSAWDRFIEDLKGIKSSSPEKHFIQEPVPKSPSIEDAHEKHPGAEAPFKTRWKKAALPVLLLLMASVSLFLGIKSILEPHLPAAPITPQRMEKPTIAVLPFVNLNGNSEQDYLSDGITEQIITALAKTPKMAVIARNSSYSYKGKPVKVQEVGRDLGVAYVLEGSVQKSGDRLRVTAQLIDAKTGQHLWAESYKRDLKDLFSLQDDITLKVITALQVQLTDGETARLYGRGTDHVDAYLKVMKGRQHVLRIGRQDNLIARELYQEAIALDSEYARAYTAMGWTYWHEARCGWTDEPEKAYEKAVELGQKAHSLDNKDSGPLMLIAWVYAKTGRSQKALEAAEKGISLEPNLSEACWIYGGTLRLLGRYKEAIPWIEKGFGLDPIPPWWVQFNLAFCYFWLGHTQKVISMVEHYIERHPEVAGFQALLARTLLQTQRPKEALAAIDKAFSLQPKAPGWYRAARAVALHANGKSDEALLLMEEWVNRSPDNPDALRYYGRLLGLLGKHEEGVLMAERAVQLRPGPHTWLFLGREYFISGQYNAAVSELEKAAGSNPEAFEVYLWLAAAACMEGRMKLARASIAEIQRLNPDYCLDDCRRDSFYEYQPEDKKRLINALKNAGLK
jgi:TolB-like protein/tetratricopeptide (TPR) repeat protein